MIYRLIELECLQRALDKYEAIAETFFDVPKPMPPLHRKGGVNMEGEHNYGPEMFQSCATYWAELLGQYNDSSELLNQWKDNDGWHGEIRSFGFVIRVTCRHKEGESHMVTLWKTDGAEPQLIISDEPEEEIE
jgi:hypothetical protein